MSIAVRCSISGIMPFMAHITTLTLNPSVDVLTTTVQVMDTHKLRCTAPQYHPGGGGINVARVVHRLGGSVQALWLGGGSLPPDAPPNFYADIAQMAQAQQKKLVLDASGPALMAAMRVGVYMVKPSLREMEEAVGRPLPTKPQRLAAAREWLALGWCEVVALSLGPEGALLVTAQGTWQAPGLDVPVRSTIGAGDTFVGAFVSTLDQMHPDTSPSTLCQALRHAMAASAAALASLGTALCQAEEVATLLDAVQVISLED